MWLELTKANSGAIIELRSKYMTKEENYNQVMDEADWFDANRESIIKDHHWEWALILHHKVLGYFSSPEESFAYQTAHGLADSGSATQLCATEDEESDYYYNPYNQFLTEGTYA
jgi:hypothetical protein